MLRTFLISFMFLCQSMAGIAGSMASPKVILPNHLSGDNVLILSQKGNNLSSKIANYYASQRHVPSNQIVTISLPTTAAIDALQFSEIIKELKPHLNDNIKVLLLTFDLPYRVDCMSITSAFALGYDKKYCRTDFTRCQKTAANSLYNKTNHLLQQSSSRVSMMLSAENFEQAKVLIDRGVKADYSQPEGDAYLVRTHDLNRSSRWQEFQRIAQSWPEDLAIKIKLIDDSQLDTGTSVSNKKNVMFYHTGLVAVPAIETNHYLPGAVAEHLTSYAGQGIGHEGQMKAFRWLENGVTGSYGHVVEPCNFPEKFPNPGILIKQYLLGQSLIEAYWKSVQQPGEGLFIGEPLARPWGRLHTNYHGKTLFITLDALEPKPYVLEQRNSPNDPWVITEKTIDVLTLAEGTMTITINDADSKFYRISEVPFYPGISKLPNLSSVIN